MTTPGRCDCEPSHHDCSDCRRFHRILNSVYEGPQLPELSDTMREREFEAFMECHRTENVAESSSRLLEFLRQPLNVAVATAFAFVLLILGTSYSADDAQSRLAADRGQDAGGIDHHAQNFARVLAAH